MDDEKIGDESQAIILLNSLPDSYKEVKAAIKFGRKSISLDEVISALRSWELEMKVTQKSNGNGESLNVRGRPNYRDHKGRNKSRSKSRSHGEKWWKSLRCHICQEMGHTRRFCPKRGKKDKEQEDTKGEVAGVQEGYESAEVLVVTTERIRKKVDYGLWVFFSYDTKQELV